MILTASLSTLWVYHLFLPLDSHVTNIPIEESRFGRGALWLKSLRFRASACILNNKWGPNVSYVQVTN